MNLKEFLEQNKIFDKFKCDYYLSQKYHATTHRLKIAYENAKLAKCFFNIRYFYLAEVLYRDSIINYMGCFKKSKLLLKEINIYNIIKDEKLIDLHKRVERSRDKIIAHQDKVNELKYEIEVKINNNGIVEKFEFPFLTTIGLNFEEDLENFIKLIKEIYNYLDEERKKHDEDFIKRINECIKKT